MLQQTENLIWYTYNLILGSYEDLATSAFHL